MVKNAAHSSRYGIIENIQNIDGIVLLAGLIGICVSSSLNIGLLKLVIFGISILSILVFIFSFLIKKKEITTGFEIKQNFSFHNEIRAEKVVEMKKLVFDDFQLENDGKYLIQLVEDDVKNSSNKFSNSPTIEKKISEPPKVSSKPEQKPAAKQFQISDFFDVNSALFSGSPEPKSEFVYLLNKVLDVIKEVMFGHTVAFFWANHEKQQMVCEAKVTDSQSFSSDRFSIQHDIVSKIAVNSKPELITRVNPVSEKELIVYYNEPEYIKSFVGVPVFFQSAGTQTNPQEAVAVLAIDSKSEEAFGYESLLLLGHFTKLISGLIKNYTDKYDLLLDSELLNSIHRFQDKIRDDLSVSNISQSTVDETSKLLKWDFISIVMHDDTKKIWFVNKVINRTGEIYVRPETNVDFTESLVGQVIKNNNHVIVEDLDKLTLSRFFKGEKLENHGSFISVPISSINKCYGTLNVESRDKYNFSKQDIEILYRLSENAASALEIYFMNNIIAEYVIIDELTGVYSKKFWLEKIEDEISRSDDFGEDLSLIYLSVDNIPELLIRYGKEGVDKILITLAKIIRQSVRSYDLVGRMENHRFGVMLVKTPANEAYLWAEKIRKTIAGIIIDLDGKSFSVTLSIGVCGATEGVSKDDLMKHTGIVLQKSVDGGGNTVRVY